MSNPLPLALVTGGLHRLGAAIAARLAKGGYALALHCRSDNPPEPSLVEALATTGVAHQQFRADLSRAGEAEQLFDTVVQHFGRTPDLLVNNAALFADSTIDSLDRAAMDSALALNLTAPVLLVQRLAAHHQAAGTRGAAVNILDQRVINPVPDQIAYSIAKQGLWQATRTLARAAAPHVRVNGVAPGLTLPTDTYEDGRMERMAALMPLGSLATPDEIADAVAWLAGAGNVTGQTIFVDGGASLTGYDRDFAYL
ncbi:SDR family oxidoreductase [Sphingomonas lacunae]|uniref:SDR family oxidoreductase n=1 Tax=Sphingomonas lacunae TaxID=2698828 RepID=A0A6M4ARC3_9SPHN|nr:SDR family oxidoreductase [Sphingomonas lacunae]QJQ31644.1 SDR family oxidoreductase [Sphingomonas lacunae]